jgi:hypothetical protein
LTNQDVALDRLNALSTKIKSSLSRFGFSMKRYEILTLPPCTNSSRIQAMLLRHAALVEPEPLRATSWGHTNLPQRLLQVVRQANTTFC